MGEQSSGSGSGVSGSYMKAFLPGLVLGLVIGGFGAAYLVPMMSATDEAKSSPGPRPGSATPPVSDKGDDKDRVNERPDDATQPPASDKPIEKQGDGTADKPAETPK